MAANPTVICNSALIKVGAGRIISLDDDSKEAMVCKEQYEKCVADLLRSHPWNFSIKRTSLAALVEAPAFGFAYKFQIPSDCLRVLEVGTNQAPWEKEGSTIVTDSGTCDVKYIARVEESLFDANFVEVAALKLASDICYSLVQSVQLREQLRAEYNLKLREARSYDAQEGGVRQVIANDLIYPRF